MRNSGNQEEFSINFLTNKVKITTGGNISDEKEVIIYVFNIKTTSKTS